MNARHRGPDEIGPDEIDPDEIDLERSIRAAYGPGAGCPPPEAWHRAALGELTPTERGRLEAHAAGCPACAAERELAAAFAAAPGPGAERDPDLAAIVARLEAAPPHRSRPPEAAPRTGGRLLRFPRPAWAPAALAAAAALALAIGLGQFALRAPAPPALPDRPAGGAVRGAVVSELAPAGELDAPPAALAWRPVEGAAGYRVTLLAPDDAELWRGEVPGPPAALPDTVMPLSSGVDYGWRVEALDPQGRTIARSERTTFRARPEPEREDDLQ